MPSAINMQFTKKLAIAASSAGISLVALILINTIKGNENNPKRLRNQNSYALAAGLALAASGAALSRIKTTQKNNNSYKHWQEIYQTSSQSEQGSASNSSDKASSYADKTNHSSADLKKTIEAIIDLWEKEFSKAKSSINSQHSTLQSLSSFYHIKKANLSQVDQHIQNQKTARELYLKDSLKKTLKANEQSSASRKLLDNRLHELERLVSKKAEEESQSLAKNSAITLQKETELTEKAIKLSSEIKELEELSVKRKDLLQSSIHQLHQKLKDSEQSLIAQKSTIESIETSFKDKIKTKDDKLRRVSSELEGLREKTENLKKQIKEKASNNPLDSTSQARSLGINHDEAIDELILLKQQVISSLDETNKKNDDYKQLLKEALEESAKSLNQEKNFFNHQRDKARLDRQKSLTLISSLESLLNDAKTKHDSLCSLQQAEENSFAEAEAKLQQISKNQQEKLDDLLTSINLESDAQKQSAENLSHKIAEAISDASSKLTDIQKLYELSTSKEKKHLNALHDSSLDTIQQSQATLEQAKTLLDTEAEFQQQKLNSLRSEFENSDSQHHSLAAKIKSLEKDYALHQTELSERLSSTKISIDQILATNQSTRDSNAEGFTKLQKHINNNYTFLKDAISEASNNNEMSHQALERDVKSTEQKIKLYAQEARQQNVLNQQQTEELYASIHKLENSHQSIENHLSDAATNLSQIHGHALNELNLLIQKFEIAVEASKSTIKSPNSKAPKVVSSAFSQSYEQACHELSLEPGSPWISVRETWRRKVKIWHPDRGGDPRLWNRRQAAYQLLAAWYEFKNT